MNKNFNILGLDDNATKEDVDRAYERLKRKYSRDRFLEGEDGNRAAKNLTNLENAYQELCEYFNEQEVDNEPVDLTSVENEIKTGNFDNAQKILDKITDRNAEWHYLQSVVFYKKNWLNESKKQLEIALTLAPNNSKYNDAYSKLRQKVENNTSRFNANNYGGAPNQFNNQNMNNRQMGGTDMGGCVDCCATWCCMELLCSGCRC